MKKLFSILTSTLDYPLQDTNSTKLKNVTSGYRDSVLKACAASSLLFNTYQVRFKNFLITI